MKITIIVEAEYVPEGREVRKPTGEKTYVMRRQGIKVYSDDYATGRPGFGDRVKVYGAGILHLTCAEHIQMVGPLNLLALDFKTVNDAKTFLEELPYDE